MSAPAVLELEPSRLLTASAPALIDALATHGALRVRGVLEPSRCEALAAAVLAARAEWTEDFGGDQFSLGRAWYTHLEQGRAREYFAGARAADALVERHLPGLQAQLRALMSALVGGAVVAREGWCGPGVHVFPAGAWLSREGGAVHFDTEGLSPGHRAARAPAVTMVLMLQAPVEGGALRVWDVRYDPETDDDDDDDERAAPRPPPDAPSVDVVYAAGDLVAIDSYALHQIQAFRGERDRISVTAHGARAGGRWESWF